MIDRIAKGKLNVILLVDTSTSMRGDRIDSVNSAINDVIAYLRELACDNTNYDFHLSLISFSTDVSLFNNQLSEDVNSINFQPLKAKGQSNLHLAYHKLNELLTKESKGGMMPDFGGAAPIILLLTDGHPSNEKLLKEEMAMLSQKGWFKVALRYGIAIELDDERTYKILKDFVRNNGDVITSYNSNMLESIIKIVVMSASKVKSQSTPVNYNANTAPISIHQEIKQLIAENLDELSEGGW